MIIQETGEYTDRGKSVIAHTPYGRFGDVQELAGATLFLASERASGFVTGVFIPVDGGYLVHKPDKMIAKKIHYPRARDAKSIL